MTRGQPELTRREREVLQLLCSGTVHDREIADVLVISVNTAGDHVRNLMAKHGCNSRGELISYAFTRGLVDVADVA